MCCWAAQTKHSSGSWAISASTEARLKLYCPVVELTMIDRQTPSLTTTLRASTPSTSAQDAQQAQDPHGDRMVCVCIFPNKTTTTPCINQLQKWRTVRRNLMRRTVRAEKNGPMIGGSILAERGGPDEQGKNRRVFKIASEQKI